MHIEYGQILAVVAVLRLASLAAPASAEECLTDWGAAGQIVRKEKLMTVQQLTQDSVLLPGKPIKTTLCKVGDDYVYKVVVRVSNGSLKTIVVDARPPDPATLQGLKSR